PDGSHLFIHRDPKKTATSIAAISPPDARAYLEYVEFWSELDRLLGPFYTRPAPLPGRRARLTLRSRRSVTAAAHRTLETLRLAGTTARSARAAEMLRVALIPARAYITE